MTNAASPSTEIAELRKKLAKLEAQERTDRAAEKGRPVIICTDKRGVFFGYAHDTDGDPIRLREARMCIYWSKDVQGVTGLAAGGPTASCRVAPAVPEIELRGITCVIECSSEAAEAWERGLWSA